MVDFVKVIHFILFQIILVDIIVMSNYGLEDIIQIRFFIKIFEQRYIVEKSKCFKHVIVLVYAINYDIKSVIKEIFFINGMCL